MNSGSTPSAPQPADYLSAVSLWTPDTMAISAWYEHVPFAFWVIEQLRPRRLVELGTHNGLSYFAFCQAMQDLGVEGQAFAVDTWQGDEHAGKYGEEVFDFVQRVNQAKYAEFSTLLRMTFDEALAEVADGSVDLLHIDGRHFEEDVRHDFESWIPKLSDRAVVLFHDTQVRERGFGVYRYWAELQDQYLTFEFEHGYGLGVLVFGPDAPPAFRSFVERTKDQDFAAAVRQAYSQIGLGVRQPQTQQAWEECQRAFAKSQRDLAAAQVAERRAQAKSERLATELAKTRTHVENIDRQRVAAQAEVERMRQSRWWRAGEPLRRVRRKGSAS